MGMELIDGLPDESAVLMLAALPEATAAAALDSIKGGRRADLFERLDRAKAARIADAMSPDERADLFQSLAEEVRSDLLTRMPKAGSADVPSLSRPSGE